MEPQKFISVHNGLPLAPILIQVNSTEAHEKLVDYQPILAEK